MLTHHQLAKLLLISRVPEQITLRDPDVNTLVEQNLVAIAEKPSNQCLPRLTRRGMAMLHALTSTNRKFPRRSSL